MISPSILSIFSAIAAIFTMSLAINIFKKVLQEDYKKPWFYIGITGLLFGLAQLLNFLRDFFNFYIVDFIVTDYIIFILEFISIVVLTYALLLEYLILQYFKGKFVKMKFVPVQEGSFSGELDINVSKGFAYFSEKKEINFMFEEFAKAVKIGFEGFLIAQNNPRQIRNKYKIEKTPIAWIKEDEEDLNFFIKNSLDENSDIVSPLQLNNIISYIDNFLEQSSNPFIMFEIDEILKMNSSTIVIEFLRYISNRIEKFSGILIIIVNSEINSSEKKDLESFLHKIE
jgi:hypothetical protein